MAGAVTMIRGTADGMVAGTAVGMIPGFTARPAIGATVRPSVSAGVGVVSMPATGARLGVGVRVIGDPVIGVVATGEVVMDGMAQADVTRGYMPEDIPIAIVLHAQAGIIT